MEVARRTRAIARSVIPAGLVAGIAMLIGWRYVAVKNVIIPDKAGQIFMFSYLDYRGGPSWWPAIALYPLIGLTIGVAFAALTAVCLRLWPLSRRATAVAASLTVAATGALTGLASAHLMATKPPVIEAAALTTAPPEPIDLSWPLVSNAPPTFDLLPPTATLVLLGTLVALLTAAAVQLLASRRTGTSQ
ncbi:hypothetical protein [Rhodococcus triatomae]